MREREMLGNRIRALDFAIWELHIFLDTHPTNKDALKRYSELKNKRNLLVEDYESRFGEWEKPVNPEHIWEWIDAPWPWEADFEKGDD